jgi:predicted transcriptional regulator
MVAERYEAGDKVNIPGATTPWTIHGTTRDIDGVTHWRVDTPKGDGWLWVAHTAIERAS